MADKPVVKRYISRYAKHVISVSTPDGPGRHIVFENGRYETSDPAEQKAIESNPDFGVTIWLEK